MVILDTDHLTLFFEGGIAGSHIRRRLATLPSGEAATSIVSFEEQSRGWLAYISKAKTLVEIVEAYRRLYNHHGFFQKMPIVEFSQTAAVEFQRLRKLGLRIGTMDLRIAAVCVTLGATVLTRNMRDFGKVPGLSVEDWSKP